MSKVDIKSELASAIKRSGYSNNAIAQLLHTTGANVSWWLSEKRGIPNDRLIEIVDLLQDYRLSCVAANYLFGVELLSKNSTVVDMPQARFFSSEKEERDRKALDERVTLLFGKDVRYRTQEDRRQVIAYLKELDEELEEKHNLKLSIIEDWQVKVIN